MDKKGFSAGMLILSIGIGIVCGLIAGVATYVITGLATNLFYRGHS